jgi:hypothetical protein
VDKCGVNHAIRHGGADAQTLQIFEIASMHLRTGSSQCLGSRIGAGQTEHLVTRLNQVPNHNRTDESGGTRYENTHGISPSL